MATKITKSELKQMIREALREELSRTKRPIKESYDTKEYMVTYRLTTWPSSYVNTELFLDAEDEFDAREVFLDYMLDPDNYYDEGDDMPTEDEIEILGIKATGR